MQTTIDVKGMTCGHCEKAVKDALESLAGVSAVTVDLDAGNVDVTFEEAKTNVATLKEAIEDQGYEVA